MNPAPRSPEDLALARRLGPLSPTPAEVDRIAAGVRARLARRPPSLAREWWDLLRARPLVNVPAALAAAALLVTTTPLAAIAGLAARLEAGRAVLAAAVTPAPTTPAARPPTPAGGPDRES